MSEIFKFSTIEEKKQVIEVWATKNYIKDTLYKLYTYISFQTFFYTIPTFRFVEVGDGVGDLGRMNIQNNQLTFFLLNLLL